MSLSSLAHISKRSFSIINRIRAREKIKNPPMERVATKPHQINDKFVTNVVLDADKRKDLTPYQQYLHDTKSMERPYTGNLWGEMSTGFYHCAVCETRLFTFDQKIKSDSGFASFYSYVDGRLNVLEEKVNIDLVNILSDPFLEETLSRHKRCECAQCSAHIGAVFFDGPYPTFLRFSANSSALKFVPMVEFQDPNIERKKKKEQIKNSRVRYLR